MFKIKNEFGRIAVMADVANDNLKFKRFIATESTKQKYPTYCLYDTVTKKYVVFDSIMFAVHYNYDKKTAPKELVEMETLIRNGSK